MQSIYPRVLAPAACALLASAVSVAQNSASFNIVTSNASTQNPGNIYSVDVNSDGLTDIIADGGYSPAAFYVSINKGNGTFAAPVEYLLPGNNAAPMCVAAADYNNDGKVDLAVPLGGTNQVAVYLGKGNGTFKSPTISTINLPSGDTFTGSAGCAAADFNGNGNVDLVAWVAGELFVLPGAGTGSFNASPYPVLSGSPSISGGPVFAGDYNGDGKADIATTTGNGASSTTINVLYGNNNFTFNATIPYTYSGILWIGSGDVNSDGITDLYAITNYTPAPQQLGVFYGTKSNTFSSYWSDTPAGYSVGAGSAAQPFTSQLTMGDYNGDGRMDLAAVASNTATNAEYVAIFLAGANPGVFTPQEIALPATSPWSTSPVAGLLSGGYLKPDVTLNQSNAGSNDTTPTTLPALLNTTNGLFGICPYPRSGKGFNVCAAGISRGNFAAFSAAVDSFGQLRKIVLWVDGSKVEEQDHTWDTHAYFDWVGTFSNGTHNATFYAYDVDNSVQRYDFTFEIHGGN
jgi:FG-GAP-like repeat